MVPLSCSRPQSAEALCAAAGAAAARCRSLSRAAAALKSGAMSGAVDSLMELLGVRDALGGFLKLTKRQVCWAAGGGLRRGGGLAGHRGIMLTRDAAGSGWGRCSTC